MEEKAFDVELQALQTVPPKGLAPLKSLVTLRFSISELSVTAPSSRESRRRRPLRGKQVVAAKAKPPQQQQQHRQKILDDVYGVVKPTNLIAIMGPSGAGKTSLLNCLSLRNRAFKGYVTYNGQTLDADGAAGICAYVQQEDLFIPTLTPWEHLMFHATMRMGKKAPAAERAATVDNIVTELGLGKCQHTLIGGQGSIIRGISGGEKKRLSFATEVLADPAVLFVDEPTSGLDSYMAASVVLMLRAAAEAGRTVLATVHQPSSDVIAMFSHLHLLADGRTAYFGPMDKAVTHFSSIGYACPNYYNPADFYIALLSRDMHAMEDSMQRIATITDRFPSSETGKELTAALAEAGNDSSSQAIEGSGPRHLKRRYSASWGLQLTELYRRTLLAYAREPILTRVRLIQAIVVGLIVGLIYLQLGRTQADVQALMGALFFVTINQSILGCIGVLQVFPNETPVMLREHASGAYRVDTFFLSRTLAELPFQILFPAIHATIIYWMIGLPRDAYVFFMFVVTIVMTANAAISMGYCISALAKNVAVALALGPMLLMPLIVFGGLLVNVQSIPDYFLWLSVFSFVQYGYEANCILIFGYIDKWECPPAPEACAFPTGQSVLAYLSFDHRSKWVDWIALLVLIVGFRCAAYLALVSRTRRSSGGY